MKLLASLFFILVIVSSAWSAPVDDARALLSDGNYAEAFRIATEELSISPRGNTSGVMNEIAGEALYYSGNYNSAVEYLKNAQAKGVADASLYLGRIAFLDYDFSTAAVNYSRYSQLINKARKNLDSNFDLDNRRLEMAGSFLDRVEKIVIIDSIAVKKTDVFKVYRLTPESGSLVPIAELPFERKSINASFAFANESRDMFLWSEIDDDGLSYIMESDNLTDNSWTVPVRLPKILNFEGNAAYPFMMPDGMTLYFASDGNESIGGYDIFVSNRDADNDSYMTPQNLGMPYNSPYDDYMFAIDESIGIGWWATDRNCLPDGMTTVYIFITNDLRSNYDADDDRISDYARISSYRDSWESEKNYSALLDVINSIDIRSKRKKSDFCFPIGNGIIYENLDDFRSDEGRMLMQRYIELERLTFDAAANLAEMRKEYSKTKSHVLGERIVKIENDVENSYYDLRKLRNEIYRIERNL